ncbi:glycerol-3-phosphate acyltransferase 1, partial [Tanacetum coccineum]
MAPFLKSQHDHIPLDQTFTKCNVQIERTLSCDIENDLLLSSKSFFPSFMLVAFEGGSILRACFLLSCYPLLVILNHDLRLRLVILITFCGMKVKDVELVGRTVLVKFYLEILNLEVYELVFSMKEARTKVAVLTSVPKVMVEGFCKEYLSVDEVVGTELHSVGGCFSGFVSTSRVVLKHELAKESSGDERKEDIGAVSCVLDQSK